MSIAHFSMAGARDTAEDPDYRIYRVPLNHDATRTAVLSRDEDGLVNQHHSEFDSLNVSQTVAIRDKLAGERDVARHERDLKRTYRRRRRTAIERVGTSNQVTYRHPWLNVGLAALLIVSAGGMVWISNIVGAKFLVGSGADMFATDETTARLVYSAPIMGALVIKAFERFLPDDRAKARYRTAFCIIALVALALWVWMSAASFAPETQHSWRAAASGGWIDAHSGVILLSSSITLDSAGGYIVFTSGMALALSNRKLIVKENKNHRWLRHREAQILAALGVAESRVADADAYLQKRAAARDALEREVRFAFRRYTQLFNSKATYDFLS